MRVFFLTLLAAAVAAAVGYLFGRSRRGAGSGAAPTAALPASAAAGGKSELYAIANAVDPVYQSVANPSEMLGHPLFEKGVALLCDSSWSAEDLLGYYTGDSAVLAALALEALVRRENDPDVREPVLRSINDYVSGTRFFSLRVLAARTPPGEGIVGKLLVRLDESWEHTSNTKLLRDFLRARREHGDQPNLGAHAEQLTDETADNLLAILRRVPEELSAPVRSDIDAWRGTRIDTEFFEQVGRLWGPDDEGADGPVIEHQILVAHADRIETLVGKEPRRSVILVGEQGVGKTSIVRTLGRRLRQNGWLVFEAGQAELLAGMSYMGQLEERIRELLERLRRRKVLWYVPDFHTLALAGRHRYGPASVLDILMQPIERGEIVVLGETTAGSFEQLARAKPRALTAMETCRIGPTQEAETLALVDRWAETHAGDGGSGLPAVIRREAWQLAQQYLGDRAAPGNVLQLLNLTRLPRTVADGPMTIDADDLITTLTRMTGLPAAILDERRGLDLGSLRRRFEQRVLGQPEAVDCLVERVAMIKAGVTDPSRPYGVFLFAGPTGTGKTEIAKTLAGFLFGSETRMIRLDMSEFQDPESLGRIVGETDDAQRGGALVDRIRKQPFSVVLLDEFEKAHPKVWDLFLQLFDDGRLTDRLGNTADFRNAIVIMTSNLGSMIPSGASLGFSDETGRFSSNSVLRDIERAFRKEFLNRIDRVVVFRPLARETMRDILRKELAEAFRRRGLRNRAWAVEWDESALDLLLEKGFTADLGARPLKRAIDRHLLAPLAMTIINHQYPEGDQFLLVRAEDGRLRVDFVDPDAPEQEEVEVDEIDAREPSERGVGLVALEPRGAPQEVALLRDAHERLQAIVEEADWQATKRDGLERTRQEGFWKTPDRFAVLGSVEYLDRIEAGIKTVGSLLERLGGRDGRARDRYPRDLVGRLAGQMYLLEEACHGVLAGDPREAFLRVEPWSDKGRPPEAAGSFARRIGAMYRTWADKRSMQCEVLRESPPGNRPLDHLVLAVSGYAAWRLLRGESGLHVLEIPERDHRGFRRAAALVRVAPQPDTPPGNTDGGLLVQAREAFASQDPGGVAIVRRYREEPSPLVRDAVHGWRTGRLQRVFGGDFDLLARRERDARGKDSRVLHTRQDDD